MHPTCLNQKCNELLNDLWKSDKGHSIYSSLCWLRRLGGCETRFGDSNVWDESFSNTFIAFILYQYFFLFIIFPLLCLLLYFPTTLFYFSRSCLFFIFLIKSVCMFSGWFVQSIWSLETCLFFVWKFFYWFILNVRIICQKNFIKLSKIFSKVESVFL